MKTRTLGKNLKVSAVGFGCMGMTHAYGAPADKKEMAGLLAQAVDMGYTFFDTAEVYISDDGIEHNEDLVGEALRPYRDRVILATKFGIAMKDNEFLYDVSPTKIRSSLEISLKRLKTDHIDLYYLHRYSPDTSIEEVAGVMKELIGEGKITHWGLSQVTEETIRRAHSVCPVTAIQNRYCMMYRDSETLFPVLEELGIGLVAFSPLANGLLSGKYDKTSMFQSSDYRNRMPHFKQEAFDANAELLRLVRSIAGARQVTPAQISLAWMISKKPYIVPIPGTTKFDRMQENALAGDIDLSAEEVRKIDESLDRTPMSGVVGQMRR
jgi:aryl-alcohol dehydrogenase-like predicted oxidoreductase